MGIVSKRLTTGQINDLNRWERVWHLGTILNEVQSALDVTAGTRTAGRAIVVGDDGKIDALDVTSLLVGGVPIDTESNNVEIYNDTGGILSKGTLVYASSYEATSGKVTVVKADADAMTKPAEYVVTAEIGIAATGYIAGATILTGLDTSLIAAGTLLYASATAGDYTTTQPTGADQFGQPIGRVLTQHATTGQIFFFPGYGIFTKIPASAIQTLTATAAELNVLDNQTRTAGAGGTTINRFVDGDIDTAPVDATDVAGVALGTATVGNSVVVAAAGMQPVTADAPLTAKDPVKVGVGGRATKYTTAQTTIQAAIAGEATAFTQPGAADTLEILQAADVAGDRGRGIVIEGSDAGGLAINETIVLDGTNTTTPVAGATSFTKVSAVYTANGAVLGAQNVTVRRVTGGAGVATLVAATSELGADIPSGTQEAYCNELTLTGPALDATYITVVGTNSADAAARERVQLDGAAGTSKVTTTTVWRAIARICLGEMTNAGAGTAKTNETTDAPPMKVGIVLTTAAARGDLVYVVPANVLSGLLASITELNILDGVGATTAELNILDNQTFTTGAGGVTARRFVDTDVDVAAIDSTAVIGVAPSTIAAANPAVVACSGVQPVAADAPLSAKDPVKVGVGGRATKWTGAQTTIQAAIAGEATAFTQPGAADTLEILQAADVAGDRGRGIVIEGSDAGGLAITETIVLDGTNTTTPVAGTTSFTKVSAVYTANGAVLGAQNVTVRRVTGGAGVCTLAGATSELGADIPSGTQEAYCNELTLEGPALDATYLTVVGTNSADATARERVQLDGAAGTSKVTTTTVWRTISRICLGEFTNAGAGAVKTNETVDTLPMKVGIALAAAAARGDLAYIAPNANLLAGLTAKIAELNKLAGASANVTATNLGALTGGGNVAKAAGGHGHALSAGASDVTASLAEVNGQCEDHILTAGAAGCTIKRFVDSDLETADIDDLAVVGVSPAAIVGAASGVVVADGIRAVVADAPLVLKDPVKVGVGGRATKHTTVQTTIQAAIAGEATAITQPGAADTLEILQAADVAGDRGRGIVIEGSNAGGVAITETIVLDAANTTTPVAGATSFTKVSAVYTANGAVLGAQNVTVRRVTGGAGVATLVAATSELGADIPSGTQEAYCNELTVTGPNADATFVTVVGIDSTDAVARERGTLDGASPSKFTTTTVFRYISRICLGEFTNAGAGAVKTNSVVDTAGMKCGIVVQAAAARGDDALVLVKPNA